jgi:hypothetical protein
MILLWILAAIELGSFPLLGAGTQTIGGYNILTVEGCLFGVMTFGIVMTMRVSLISQVYLIFSTEKHTYNFEKVIGELYRPGGGAYNVDGVLSVMVRGLEEELRDRLAGGLRDVSNSNSPSPQYEDNQLVFDEKQGSVEEELLLGQGASGKDILRTANKIVKWARRMNNVDG